MMHEQFTLDLFIERTKEIIKQYEKISSIPDTPFYDVTLSVNCLYGLLMLPEEQHRLSLPKEDAVNFLGQNNLSGDEISIKAWTNNRKKTPYQVKFDELIISLRNGLAHWGAKPHKGNKNTDQSNNVEFIKGSTDAIELLCITGNIDDFEKTVSTTFHFIKNGNQNNPIPPFLELIKPAAINP